MSDFSDDVTLIIGGSVLASIEPNIVDVGGGPLTVGGAFYCRRKSGTVAVAVPSYCLEIEPVTVGVSIGASV